MIDQAVRAALAGVPIGLQLGATGTGGAILGVPMMVYLGGISFRDAAAMSLVIVAVSSWVGAWEYSRQGLVKINAALAFSWTGVIGSWAGTFGHRLVRDEVLLILLGVVLLMARALVARRRALADEAGRDDTCAVRFPRTCWIKVGGMGLFVGTLNGLFGVGGGFMVVPALIVVLGFSTRMAVGTSLSIIGMISLGGVVGHLQAGGIDWSLSAFVLLGSVAGLTAGVWVGGKLPAATMARITATITVTVAVWLILVNGAKLLGLSS